MRGVSLIELLVAVAILGALTYFGAGFMERHEAASNARDATQAATRDASELAALLRRYFAIQETVDATKKLKLLTVAGAPCTAARCPRLEINLKAGAGGWETQTYQTSCESTGSSKTLAGLDFAAGMGRCLPCGSGQRPVITFTSTRSRPAFRLPHHDGKGRSDDGLSRTSVAASACFSVDPSDPKKVAVDVDVGTIGAGRELKVISKQFLYTVGSVAGSDVRIVP